MLVELPGGAGIAKLDSASGDRCIISIFHSLRRTEQIDVALGDVRHAFLSAQTRVYVRVDDRIRIGRVTNFDKNSNGLVDYEIRFPNNRQEYISELKLFVRPWSAPEDPADVLAAGGAESQFLYDRRQRAMNEFVALRGAAQGLTSLISSNVDFVPHQVAAVRRVLSDPIQRYLLADEVGLGKTIEAGLIIRQHLIDHRDQRVLITAPAPLVRQWRSEMNEKLRLKQFGGVVRYCAHGDLSDEGRAPDVLVVDEAHHLVGVTEGSLASSALRLRELAAETSVMLLLSATPALGDEHKFLSLLNLLDAEAHPLDDLDGFRSKLRRRREIGRLLLSLDAQAPSLVLRQRAKEMLSVFAEDAFVQAEAPRLIAATQSSSGDLSDICERLKTHVADNYRVHQRLIRSRRADAQGWEFRSRGPQSGEGVSLAHVRTEESVGDETQLLALVDDWRIGAAEAFSGDADALARVSARYAQLLEAVGSGRSALQQWLKEAVPDFEREREILSALATACEGIDEAVRMETMVVSTRRLIRTIKDQAACAKVVVFASDAERAGAFFEAFCEGDRHGCALLTDAVGGDAEVGKFVQSGADAVLVTDRSGEEGLNLSAADAIVHLDLPFSAARLEQRIGRLDRYGRRQDIVRQRVLLPAADENGPWAAWFDFLSLGLGVFNRSISDIQFMLDEFQAEAFQALLTGGGASLAILASSARRRIDEERRAQDEQYALDRIALNGDDNDRYLEHLERVEEDEGAIEGNIEAWLIGVLQLKRRPYAWPDRDPFKLSIAPETLIPRAPWQSEFVLDEERPYSWRRRMAVGNSAVTLLRPGAPLLDAAERFTRWDDRGAAFITLRHANVDDWVGFKLCFVIEPNSEPKHLLSPSIAELARHRRAQRYLSAYAKTLFVDLNAVEVSDPAILDVLARPYSNAATSGIPGDVNLGSRPQLLAQFIDSGEFARLCRSIGDAARARLEESPEYREGISAAAAQLERDIQRRRQRHHLSPGATGREAEVELLESLMPAVQRPIIRLDSMGCFILTRRKTMVVSSE